MHGLEREMEEYFSGTRCLRAFWSMYITISLREKFCSSNIDYIFNVRNIIDFNDWNIFKGFFKRQISYLLIIQLVPMTKLVQRTISKIIN